MELTKNERILAKLGRTLGIKPGSRLSASHLPMVEPLHEFFVKVIPYLNNAKRKGKISLSNMANALDCLGVSSAGGSILSKDHVSNAVRKSVLKIGPAYKKPEYKGKNHHAFNSIKAPLKEDYASLGRS